MRGCLTGARAIGLEPSAFHSSCWALSRRSAPTITFEIARRRVLSPLAAAAQYCTFTR